MLAIKDIKSGTEIRCHVEQHVCKDAKIQVYDDMVYICSHKAAGDECPDKLGYPFSWSVGPLYELTEDTDRFFKRTGVHDVELLEWDPVSNHDINY